MSQFQNKVCLVTGAASGLGAATSQQLADQGATVLLADINATAGAEVAAAVGGQFLELNVADPDAFC